MNKERELLERSLYFLEPSDWEEDSDTSRTCIKLSREIQELLAQPETKQEPVAWMNDSGGCFLSDGNKYSENWTALYTEPKQPESTAEAIMPNGVVCCNGCPFDCRCFIYGHHGLSLSGGF